MVQIKRMLNSNPSPAPYSSSTSDFSCLKESNPIVIPMQPLFCDTQCHLKHQSHLWNAGIIRDAGVSNFDIPQMKDIGFSEKKGHNSV